MTLKQDVTDGVQGVLDAVWNTEEATVVPDTDDVVLKNGAKLLDAVYLYADMADSTGLAQGYKNWAVAKVMRSYLNAATRILKYYGGEIRSFDGDRVMAIYIGGRKNTNAVKAAMKLSGALNDIINPAIKKKWSDFNWTMQHGVGIDTGQAMIVRGGVRGSNDLVSIGRAPNIAAKLSDIRHSSKRIFITKTVYDTMLDEVKYVSGTQTNMWESMGTQTYGTTVVPYYGSSYRWAL